MLYAPAGPGLLRKAEAAVGAAVKVVIGLLLAAMVVLVFANVISRYFLNSAIAWSEEVARFMMIWLSFLGAVIAFINNEHLGLDIMVKMLPKKGANTVLLVSNVLVIVAIAFFSFGGFSLMADSLESGWRSPATDTPYGLIYTVVPFSGFVMLLQALIKLIENVSMVFGKGEKA